MLYEERFVGYNVEKIAYLRFGLVLHVHVGHITLPCE